MLRRVLLGPSAGLTLLFMLPILLIRAQPYESGDLGRFLTPPPNCDVPCFLGVRPRHTTVAQALEILRANEDIEFVQLENNYTGQSIYWRWKEYPEEYRRYTFEVSEDNIVTRPSLPSTTRLGDLQLILGQPERVTAAVANEYMSRAVFMLEYPSRGLHLFIAFYPCDVNQRDFWQLRQDFGVYGTFFVGLGNARYSRILPDTRLDLDPQTWTSQLRDFCKR